MQRTPLSKRRNKHLQTTLIEAAKMAPRYSPTLALLYDREKQKGHANRATLTVAYLMAVDRGQTHFLMSTSRLIFLPPSSTSGSNRAYCAISCRSLRECRRRFGFRRLHRLRVSWPFRKEMISGISKTQIPASRIQGVTQVLLTGFLELVKYCKPGFR